MRLWESPTSVIQDGVEYPASALQHAGTAIARQLAACPGARLAVVSSRADIVIPALLGCERAGCELLLLRGQPPEGSVAWTRLAVDAVLSDRLDVLQLRAPAVAPTGFAVLLGTSGTTGAPRIARHRPERLAGRVRAPGPGRVAPTWLLTYHPASFAGTQVLLTALAGGGRLVASGDFGSVALAQTAAAVGATHISGTPTFWRAFLVALGADARRLPLRQITLGGEAVDQATLDRLAELYPSASIAHIYASTEAGALFAVRDRRAGFPSRWLHEGVDGVALRVGHGMLEVQSPRAMDGYVCDTGQPALTEDGWLMTQDLVEERGDRVLFLGRADSVINVGGAKVSPDEVEAVLLSVEGVAEARVSGAANPISGQLVTADVVLHRDVEAEAVRRAITVRARAVLPPFKVPRVIRFVDVIPSSAAGKKMRPT